MMNFRSAFSLLLFAFSSSSSATAKLYEVDNNVRSLKGAEDEDEEHRNRNLKKAAKKSGGQGLAAAEPGVAIAAAALTTAAEGASTFIAAFEILEAAAEVAAKLEKACCVSCNQDTSTSNICDGLFELECASPIAQVIGACLDKLCTCDFRPCALELLIQELSVNGLGNSIGYLLGEVGIRKSRSS